ncbi:putative quinol monooxygenase [Luteibacter pinisoli]|uniref:putative quinol monooxygenase n=1 Tax=Luteibacter pinisoli TaxID=2589080 RepID=UPI00147681E9|nr:antibiotic biosynthesis monooxygenase [Luteibacter pinisoli]
MNRFQAVVRFEIHAGKEEEFRRIAANMIRLTREKDTGTLRLDIFVNDDGSEAVFYEEFVSPEARLDHLANMGTHVADMLAIGNMRAEVWTHGDHALRASVQGFDVRFYTPFLRLKA